MLDVLMVCVNGHERIRLSLNGHFLDRDMLISSFGLTASSVLRLRAVLSGGGRIEEQSGEFNAETAEG